MSRYIAAYDVSDDNQRQRVARVLDRFGVRLQWSVFEVWLDPDELVELRRKVGPLLSEHDQFEIIPIDVSPNRGRWRWGSEAETYEPVTVLGR
ncbi:MAG: CRISPR-associated endonuclease Cas2 [Pirellulaceae bacterium]|nr:CRISPR-associated endonuclease Cas2 [Pirellulaceae bacterium]